MNIADLADNQLNTVVVTSEGDNNYLITDGTHIFEISASSEEDALAKYQEVSNFKEDIEFTKLAERELVDTQYQRDREYPSLEEQADMAYWDRKNGTTTLDDALDAVKDANPKPGE